MKRIPYLSVAALVMFTAFLGIFNITSENARGTDVSGIVYDGSGGPWTLAQSPYTAVGDVTIPPGETLTVEAGVVVSFNANCSLYVEGNLNAIGEPGSMIIFTSKRGTMINLGRGDAGLKLRRLEEVWKRITTKHVPVNYILCEYPDRIVVGLEERG